MTNRRSRVAAILLAFAITFLGGIGLADAAPATLAAPAQNACGNLAGFSHSALSSLPKEATTTYNLIKAGGPFPYPKNDGVVFTNTERILPACASSYYREYTVPTPGASNRGTRRIIKGDGGEFFYTGDHYATFSVIDVSGGGGGGGTPQCGDTSGLAKVNLSALSSAAKTVVDNVRNGATGTVYENREGVIPACSAGYYHLFPVGTNDRVISGQGGEVFYTPDRYVTFKLVNLNA
jgi:guanyl-specific ribonuclease Sa